MLAELPLLVGVKKSQLTEVRIVTSKKLFLSQILNEMARILKGLSHKRGKILNQLKILVPLPLGEKRNILIYTTFGQIHLAWTISLDSPFKRTLARDCGLDIRKYRVELLLLGVTSTVESVIWAWMRTKSKSTKNYLLTEIIKRLTNYREFVSKLTFKCKN